MSSQSDRRALTWLVMEIPADTNTYLTARVWSACDTRQNALAAAKHRAKMLAGKDTTILVACVSHEAVAHTDVEVVAVG